MNKNNNYTMILNIITPKSSPMEIEAAKVFLPGVDGRFEILDNHAPLIAELGSGEIVWTGTGNDAKENRLAVNGGFVEVLDNKITVVARQ